MVHLSVNVNKVATVRNSRGGHVPSVLDAARVCLDAGAPGVTVHPRADERHVRASDVREIAALLASRSSSAELNVEGDPRRELLDLVLEVRPAQCTLVPVVPGEITSQAGWTRAHGASAEEVIPELHRAGVRVSVFVDPDDDAIEWAAGVGADRIELYTEPYARAFERGAAEARESLDRYRRAAERAHDLGLGVNAGHDLDLDNLGLFATLPHLDEVSIGHALVSRAIFVGLATVVREYLDVLAGVRG